MLKEWNKKKKFVILRDVLKKGNSQWLFKNKNGKLHDFAIRTLVI